MIIPIDKIPAGTLINILDDFILREGTDYGHAEVSLEDKRSTIKANIIKGKYVITYSELHETCSIHPTESFGKLPKRT